MERVLGAVYHWLTADPNTWNQHEKHKQAAGQDTLVSIRRSAFKEPATPIVGNPIDENVHLGLIESSVVRVVGSHHPHSKGKTDSTTEDREKGCVEIENLDE